MCGIYIYIYATARLMNSSRLYNDETVCYCLLVAINELCLNEYAEFNAPLYACSLLYNGVGK